MLSQIKNDLSLTNIIHLYFSIIPRGVRVNVNEARGRKVEGVFSGKSGIKEIIPIDKIRCKYCSSEFGTIYSLKKHEYEKHERRIVILCHPTPSHHIHPTPSTK